MHFIIKKQKNVFYVFTYIIKLTNKYTRTMTSPVNEIITVELHKLQQMASMISFSTHIFFFIDPDIFTLEIYSHTFTSVCE